MGLMCTLLSFPVSVGNSVPNLSAEYSILNLIRAENLSLPTFASKERSWDLILPLHTMSAWKVAHVNLGHMIPGIAEICGVADVGFLHNLFFSTAHASENYNKTIREMRWIVSLFGNLIFTAV